VSLGARLHSVKKATIGFTPFSEESNHWPKSKESGRRPTGKECIHAVNSQFHGFPMSLVPNSQDAWPIGGLASIRRQYTLGKLCVGII